VSHDAARAYMANNLKNDFEAQAYVDGFANPFFPCIKWTSKTVLACLAASKKP
jgi:hypothetical protein